MTLRTAYTETIPRPYEGCGIAGDICRAALEKYETMEFIVSHRNVVNRAGQPKTLEERFSDIHLLILQHEAEILTMHDSDDNFIVYPAGELPTMDEFMRLADPEKSARGNAVQIIFVDGTSIRIGVKHGLQIDDSYDPEDVRQKRIEQIEAYLASRQEESAASPEAPAERHI